jgi:signal transduction histidine kinase
MDRSGEYPVGVMIQITDATEVSAAKKRAADANQELMELSRELESKNKELESIIGVVSHDLRAPLVNVKGFGNEIKKDCIKVHKLLSDIYIPQEVRNQLAAIFDESVPQSLNFIETSADAMNTLVKSLVDVAKIGLAIIKPEKLDMNEIVRIIISNLEIKFKQARAQVCFDNLASCWADKAQTTQIFTNLIDNAVKYLDLTRLGQICIGGQQDKDRMIYCVSDNGVGIPAQDQDKVFEIFTRLASKAHAGGEGMGLTMVKRMIDRNNGKIWMISEPEKGSSFFVSLPVAAPPP